MLVRAASALVPMGVYNHPPRVHARYICRLPLTIFNERADARLGDGYVNNLSQSGALLVTNTPLNKGTSYTLRFSCQTIQLSVQAVVVRLAQKDPKQPYFQPYGARFLASPAEEQKIKLAVDTIRTRSESRVFDKLSGYWDR